ncbi:MAG: hypothetical protein ACRDPS_09640 [Nocardioides sp.]|uniref:hypothetical protein n=1 Tax=Nocardioides sp. TaxID=35761 RepID=UPI003D6BE71E
MKISTRDVRAIGKAIANREAFTTHGAIRGEGGRVGIWDAGRLPAEYVDGFLASEYAIYSYATPIAWFGGGRWTVPDTKYSLTTTRHQATVRGALAAAQVVVWRNLAAEKVSA